MKPTRGDKLLVWLSGVWLGAWAGRALEVWL